MQVTHTVPASGYPITNIATMVDLSTPGMPSIHAASTWIQIKRKPEHDLYLPLVIKT